MVSFNYRVTHKRAAKNRRADGFYPTATFEGMDPTDTPGLDTNTPSNTPPPVISTPTSSPTPTPPPPPPTTSDTATPPPPPSTTVPPPADTNTSQPPPTNVVLPPVEDDTSTTPIAATPPPRPTGGQSTVLLTTSQTLRSVAPAETSGTTEPQTESGTNVGGIIGGLAAGLIGLTLLVFAIRYILRRRSRQNEADGGFNSNDFRRSAVLMNDPPTHEDTVSAGFNPRPPTMIERRLASPAPTFGTQYGAPGPHYFDGQNGQEYGTVDQYGQQYQSFTPGQVMHQNNMSPPHSATSANPLYPNAPYAQSPFSPIGTPVYEGNFDDRAGPSPYLTRQPSSAAQSNRPPSYPEGSVQYANYPASPPQAAQGYPTTDYVDLDRSSVSPYQAAQYAEISKKLNTEVPAGLNTPAVAQYIQGGSGAEVSPFADPSSPMTPQGPHGRNSVESAQLDNFPVPPSPAHTSSSQRIDSTPPMLPEITVESRVSVNSYDFPNSVRGSAIPPSPLGSGYPSGATAAGNGLYANQAQYPTTPSPLASSFAIESPHAGSTFESAPPPSPRAPTAAAATKSEKRPETVYDAEDAYGGI
ncbi:hypothetical protein BDZ94DRAFT_1214321 [Collybia nuda]|uniref:Uncharacterized protein n=1 Tax=Collybia nuda TaxID=64659 RepID=A0A9P5Y8J0_9AGAR|nr:hypothetical protein BDZ94DRAFT_1214321 [Collybia nuda]